MSELTTVTQVCQIGVESTEGTAVAANRYLPSLTMELAPSLNIDAFRPTGNKFPTIHALGKEWSTVKIAGKPTYDEIMYLFDSLLAYSAPVQEGATTAYKTTNSPSSTDEDTVKSFTIENGSSVRARKAAGARVTELSLKGDRDKLDLTGGGLARAFTDGITLTSTPTAVPQIPILPSDVSIYLDGVHTDLGTTKLTREFGWEWNIASRFGAFWPVDAALASFGGLVELPVGGTVKLTVMGDSNGMGFLGHARTGVTKFLRIEAVSDALAGTAKPYKLTLDQAVQVADVGELKDEDGIYAYEVTLDMVHDATYGRALQTAVTNTRTAL